MRINQNLSTINDPIFLSSTFIQDFPSQWGYSRVDNPTRLALEGELAEIEKAKFALAFSSGSSAISCLLTMLKRGDHILCHHEVYEGTHRLLNQIFNKFGVNSDFINLNNRKEIKKSIKPNTKLILFENITNPNLEKINIEKIHQIIKKNKILVAVDNTICTPIFENPLSLGADIVVHSLTKFIGGHHDLLGGAIMINDINLFRNLRFIQQSIGLVLDPFSCSLVSRSLKTLDLRMKKHTANAIKVFSTLKVHKLVHKINFPGISGIISFQLNNEINWKVFLKRLKFIKIAQSFGGTETTILHPVSMMNLSISVDKNFFRLSVGLEKSEQIIRDIIGALK